MAPNLSGFGHAFMTGLHSEFICYSGLNLINEYTSDNLETRELISIDNPYKRISLDNLYFMSDGNSKPFYIAMLLKNDYHSISHDDMRY